MHVRPFPVLNHDVRRTSFRATNQATAEINKPRSRVGPAVSAVEIDSADTAVQGAHAFAYGSPGT